jgi:hypothetical protein
MDIFSLDLSAGTGLAAMAGTLVVLALLDSTSFGTLAVPVWFLMAPGRPRAGRILVYLGTIAGFYLAVGVAVLLGAGALLARYQDVFATRGFAWVQLAAGVALFALSFRFDGKRAARRRAAQEAAGSTPRPGRLQRWRERALGLDAGAPRAGGASDAGHGAEGRPVLVRARPSALPLMGLALGAGVIEVASMLPYLGAIGILSASGLPTGTNVTILAVYCLVMVLPALLLLGGRLTAARLVDPLLRRIDAWFAKNGEETTGWILGIIGAVLALRAASTLGIVG